MGRLIDADAIDKALVNAQAECKKNGGNFRFGVLSNVRANIANAPTIDAIPVEWIENMLKEWLKGSASFETCGAISAMLVRWREEQEA